MMQAQFALAVDLGLLDMHIDTERAAVQLRCTDLHQLTEGLLERRLLEQRAKLDELLGELRRLLEVVQTL
ncbi:hypothetical protein D3C81_1158000 [compost metagenome]